MSPLRLPDVDVLGSINVDTTFMMSRLPRPGETVLADSELTCVGGKGANQAVALARLGARVRCLGAVGTDDAGRFALEALAGSGVDVSAILTTGAPTGRALVNVDEEGENQIVVSPGANTHLDPEEVVLRGEVLLCQLEVPPHVVDAVVASAGDDRFVAVNAAPARTLAPETLRRADLVIVNRLEHEALPELATARQVIVTDGASGAFHLHRGEVSKRAAGMPAHVRSTVGAGDAFTAAVTLAIAAGLPPETALAIGVRVGASAVESASSQPELAPLETYLPSPA